MFKDEGIENLGESVSFDWTSPSYESRIKRLHYTLLYAYAYGFDYYLMFCVVFHYMKEREWDLKADVASFGCGNGAEYLALAEAVRAEGADKFSSASYIGIDKADWEDCHFPILKLLSDSVSMANDYHYNTDAATYLKNSAMCEQDGMYDRNFYIFPKSCIEMEDLIGDFQEFFASVAERGQKTIYLCVIPPHADVEQGRVFADRIVQIFKNSGYRLESSSGGTSTPTIETSSFVCGWNICNEHLNCPFRDISIWEEYPKDIKEALPKLGEKYAIGNSSELSLNRYPMIKDNYLASDVYILQKR